jgi:site-specific recombinase XerD
MLSENITSFLDYYQSLSYSKKSLQALGRYLSRFNGYVNGLEISAITEIAYSHLAEFAIGVPGDSATVGKMRVWALRRFFGYLKLKGVIADNPAEKLTYPKIEKRVPRFLAAAEFTKMLALLGREADKPYGLRNLLMVLLMGVLGLRISAIHRLNSDDVDLRLGRLFIQEKGGSHRFLLLPAVMVFLLDRYLLNHPGGESALFLSRRGRRISSSAIQRLTLQIARKCGYSTRMHPHVFRHTAGTQLNQVADIHIVREVLGHQRESNTRRYIHLNPHEYGQYMKRHPYIKKLCE